MNTDDVAPLLGTLQTTEVNIDDIPKTASNLISTYRSLAMGVEVGEAVEEIVNDAIIMAEESHPVSINVERLDVGDDIKKKVTGEFEEVLNLLNFNNDATDIFRRWYIDGLLYCSMEYDNGSQDGIKSVTFKDPQSIIETPDGEIDKTTITNIGVRDDPLLLKGDPPTGDAKVLEKEKNIRIESGLADPTGTMSLSYLHRSIKAANDLKLMEDSLIILRVSRAPDRRAFYVDTGSLPEKKAEQHLRAVSDRFKSNISYDPATGNTVNSKNVLAMTEDYWLPRKEGSRGTEVVSLPGASNLGDIDDITYLLGKLIRSLNVPASRFSNEGGFNIGRTTEITRDEVRFSKTINRLRRKFSELFSQILKRQLILKKIIEESDWDVWKNKISYIYMKDNYFQELKESEVLGARIATVAELADQNMIGSFFSKDTIRRKIMKQTTEEIEREDELIAAERKNDGVINDG